MNPLALLLILFFAMVLMKIPIAYALGLASMYIIHRLDIPMETSLNIMYTSVNSFALLAIPFFLLLGRLMNVGGITDRLFKLSEALVGHISGALAHINVLISMMFAGLSGSAQADAAGIGSMLIPTMVRAGYKDDFSVAITATSSVLGVIIPPSVLMVVYAAMGGVSVGALFLAGIVPGIMIGLGQMIYSYIIAKKYGYGAAPKVGGRERWQSFKGAIPSLILPLLILGGVSSGIFTATESAAFSTVYAMVLMFGIYKNFKVKDLPELFADAAVSFSLSLFAVATAGIMGWLIAYLNAPEMISGVILGITSSTVGIFGLLMVFLLIIGTFLSPMTAIIIFMPIFNELARIGNIHPVHMGIVTILTLSLGMVTPPYGTCLMISAEIGGISTTDAMKGILPILAVMVGIILLGVLVPDLFIGLPKLLMPDFM